MKVSIHFFTLGVALTSLTACSSTPSVGELTSQAVRVQEVRIGPVAQGRAHLAEVVPAQTVRILAQVPGTIVELGPLEGTPLEQGDLIARISAPDVAARVSRVTAERKRAGRERDFVCGQLDTDRVLAASGDLAGVQLDLSEKICSSANLSVDAAQAAEREASVAGTRAREATPFAGQVLSYFVDVGQSVMPGTPLAQYGGAEHQLRLRVVASDLDDIAIGSRVITPDGDGRVIAIGAQAQGPARLFEVFIALESDQALRVGQTLTITVVTDEWPDTSAVPETAVGSDGEEAYVLIAEDTHLRRVGVRTGPRDGGWVAIEPALPAGSLVVSSSLTGLDLARPVLAVRQ